MHISVYIDESGDLGWKFNAPYRQGGSSQYLTISGILIAHEKRHLLKRLMKDLFNKTKTAHHQEVKWAKLTTEHRLWIAEKLVNLKTKLADDIEFLSITVSKEKVAPHIRLDPNKLYNYMIKLAFAEKLSAYDLINLNIDQRSLKVESGHSLHDYLQTVIWFDYGSQSILKTKQCDSRCDLNVQLADILSGIVQNHFEDGKSEPFHIIENYLTIKTLFL